MGAWRWWVRRLEVLFRKGDLERELDEEIRWHIERETELHVAAGVPPAEARRRALVAFGGVERHKERVRDVRGGRLLDDLVRDVQVGLRAFGRQRAFTLTVLATLGLGMGGTLAMFGVLDGALFRALPYERPGELVLGRVTAGGSLGNTVSAPDYYDVREEATSFVGLSAFTPFTLQATVTGAGDAERVRAPYVAWDLFRTLGVSPVLGRHFLPEEGEPGGASVLILSHGYWERRFASDPGVLGRVVTLDGTPSAVVGVLPEGFRFPVAADVWRPMVRGGAFAQSRQFHNFVWIGRLAPGVTLEAARAEVDAITARLAELYPESNRDKGMYLVPLHEALVAGYRTTLWVLTGAVLALLLVACANAASMLLARSSVRTGELALRAVLGAGRGRLVRQLLVENLLLAAGGAAVGLALAGFLQRGILALVPLDLLGGVEPGLTPRTLWATLGVGVLTLLSFGVLPALRSARTDPGRDLASGGARSGGSREAARFRSGLVVGQVALTAVLLLVAGLLVRSLSTLRGVDTGFDPRGLVTAEVHLPPGKYPEPAPRVLFYTELRDRIAALPGVEAVGLTSSLPVRDGGNNVRVGSIEAWAEDAIGLRSVYQRMVLPGYFRAMGLDLVAGRDVADTDVREGPNVVVLSAALAARLYPGLDPLGRVVGVDVGDTEPWRAEVVGVVADVVATGLQRGKEEVMYFAYGQRSPASMRLAVRVREGSEATQAAALRPVLQGLDTDVPLAGVGTMEANLAASLADRTAVVLVLGIFATVALLLSAVGLYGVLAYQVSRRAREIGVRMALGASVRGISREVLGGGLRLVGWGLALGLPASVAAVRPVRGMLYEVRGADPVTYLGVVLFLGLVASVACLVPARRAARVDPAVAFRSE